MEKEQTNPAMAPLFRFLRNQDPGMLCLLTGVFFLPLFLPVAILCLAAAGGLWLGRLIWTGEVCLRRSPLDLWIVAFAALAAVSVSQSAHAAAGWYNYGCLVGLYLLAYFLVTQTVHTRQDAVCLVAALLVSAAVVCLWGLWQYQAGIDVTAERWVDGEQFPGLKTRVFSTLGNPNVLAAFLIMVVGLTAGWILDVRERWPRLALFGLLGVSVLCVLLTYSRGAWLTLGVMALVTAAAWKHWTWRMVALAAVAVAVIGVAAQDAFMARLLSIRGMFNPADSSVALRWALWESTLAMIEEHPWLGLGWGSYRFVYPEYDFFVQNPDVIIYHGHNTLLSLAAEIGIPGMICFAMAWATAVLRTLVAMHRTDRPKKGPYLGLALALLGMAAFSLTDHVLFNIQVTAVFWVLLALASVVPVGRTASERQLASFHKKFAGLAGVFRSRENIIQVR